MTKIFIRPKEVVDAPLFRRDSPPGNSFIRFITANAVAGVTHKLPYEVAAAMWPSDRDVIELTRAASAPAMVGQVGWAAELVHKVVIDALAALGPASAAAQIIQRGLVLSFNGAGVISAPGFVAGAGNASFVAEGAPIPVRQLASTAATLNPHKLAAIAVLTRELIESSNAEAAITDALIKSAGAALDTVFFDANAESAARPAGMRNGVTAITPSGATDLWQAAFEDVAALINAVAPVAGNGPYAFVGSPGRVLAMQFRFNVDVDDANTPTPLFYASTAMGNDLAVLAPSALVAAASPTPDVETATAGTLVMDTAPGPAGTTGQEKSMFQTDSMAIKVRWPLAWALRDSRGFAWLTPNWNPG
jgi:hypothetical protein